jgi:aspartyl-tRNA(Asn)/glutamyl-tRNA(Gln) amidotransferase subunit B
MNDRLVLIVGLEVHAELSTVSKMFCACKNDPDEEGPNVHVCPVCMGHPGTLPTINKEAVKKVLQVGTAVGGNLAYNFTEFDRKNYFYPDIPKGYQISQYKYPLVSGGKIADVELTRIHLEEDTAQSTHHAEGGGYSLVNFNRAGLPLMELVTEPVIRSAEQAGKFAREFQLLLRYLGAGKANLDKGEMRVEANISVGRENNDGTVQFGTKVEVKNLNSFKSVEGAIAYEEVRHRKLIEDGKQDEIVQETRGWDETKQVTFSQRKKEGSADYRYFPEPDLPKLVLKDLPEFDKERLQKTLPELPWQRRDRYTSYGISAGNAEVLLQNSELVKLFDDTRKKLEDQSQATLLSNYITSDLVSLSKDGGAVVGNVTAETLSQVIGMVSSNELSSRGAKDLLVILYNDGGNDAKAIAKENSLLQISDTGAIESLADELVAENEAVVQEIRDGKEAGYKFLVGQGMKKTGGQTNPGLLMKALQEKI